MAKDLYGVKSIIKDSIAETPVVINTELVFIGCAENTRHLNEPMKITRDNYTSVYSAHSDGNCASLTRAFNAFKSTNLDHCWMINVNRDDSSTVANPDYTAFATDVEITTALQGLDVIYTTYGVVPTIVCLPGVHACPRCKSIIETVAAKCDGEINDVFHAQVFANLGLENDDWAESISGYGSDVNYYKVDPSHPDLSEYRVIRGNVLQFLGSVASNPSEIKRHMDRLMPLCAVGACLRAEQDIKNVDNLPYRSIGNLAVPMASIYAIEYFDAEDSAPDFDLIENPKSVNDALAANGLIIAKNIGQRRYRTWGDHTSAVTGDGDVDDELNRFDSNVAIAHYLANRFILKWQTIVDAPMKISLRNDIIASEQSNLDYMVSVGALIGSPKCEFVSTPDAIGLGQFKFLDTYTTVIPAKYLELGLVWTSEGLKAYTE